MKNITGAAIAVQGNTFNLDLMQITDFAIIRQVNLYIENESHTPDDDAGV